MSQRAYNGLEIAVIGMACRFPKSPNVSTFWENLIVGNECITIDTTGKQEGRIKAKGILEDNECFDFYFFGYSPHEAEFMDPQTRILHECAWEALEDAGYNPFQYDGLIGHYVGASTNPTSYLHPFLKNGSDNYDLWSNLLYSDKDFISTRVSHKLNLRGPSLTLDTACSTSLAALDVASQGLLTGKCDIALAGGVSITYHDEEGYVYREGFISSPDGHCRTFDAEARGTVTGNGVGLVVLKRLDDALRDGDRIDAVILASAMNNDGNTKLGYTAPSREGQIEVIRQAQQMAEIDAESIGYVEAHGTGTQVGDPVEIDALKLAFDTPKKNYCALGAVKTNIGHLDTAAGIAGFIKAVLVLKNQQIPPTLHFKQPNPKFDLDNSPFFINKETLPWGGNQRKRAAVSSFGMGGTNIHVVLEEAPANYQTETANTSDVFLFSARSQHQLDALKQNVAAYIASGAIPPQDFNNAAYTLRVGRRHFEYRQAVTAASLEDLANKLATGRENKAVRKNGGKIVFMFSGQGGQYVNMTRQLYLTNECYRTELDHCFALLEQLYGRDIKSVLFAEDPTEINNTLYAQPVLVVVEYCLARLLMQCGVQPDMVIGHSIGEYSAACIAGIFSLEDTLKIVARRAQLMSEQERGAMLSVTMDQEKITAILPANVSLAAENSPRHQVVSGSFAAINQFKETLEAGQYACTELKTSHAFHSPMMLPLKASFERVFSEVVVNEPELDYFSNLTGRAVGYEELTAPTYWGNQLTSTVRFKECIEAAANEGATQFLEIGPGQALQAFVKATRSDISALGFVRHPKESVDDINYLLGKLGMLWETGTAIDWNPCLPSPSARRIALPTYPFAKNRIPVPRVSFENITEGGVPVSAEQGDTVRYYAPRWEQSVLANPQPFSNRAVCLFFSFDVEKDHQLITILKEWNQQLLVVEMADCYNDSRADVISVRATRKEDYQRVLEKLPIGPGEELKVVVSGGRYEEATSTASYAELEAFVPLVQSVATLEQYDQKHLYVITHGLHNVLNRRSVNVASSPLVGALKVVQAEQKEISCINLDIDTENYADLQLSDLLVAELTPPPRNTVVAFRNDLRWTPGYQEIVSSSEGQKIKHRGTYLITGGVGGMASTLARYLLKNYDAHVVLIGRSDFLSTFCWNSGELDGVDAKYHARLKALVEINNESLGTLTSYEASISDASAVQEILRQVVTERGGVDGVFHTAGVADYGGVMQRRDFNSYRSIMEPKVVGTEILIHALTEQEVSPDFTLLFSSNGNTVYAYKYGQSAYNAANEYLDSLAADRTLSQRFNLKTINWNDWYEVGMTVDSLHNEHRNEPIAVQAKIDDGLYPDEGMKVIENVLNLNTSRVVVSKKDLNKEIAYMNHLLRNDKDTLLKKLLEHTSTDPHYKKPELDVAYQSPRTAAEEAIISELSSYLQYEDIGVYDNFFELGLSSLDLVQISQRLSEVLNKPISATALFTYPTVDALSSSLGREEPKVEAPDTALANDDALHNSLSLFS